MDSNISNIKKVGKKLEKIVFVHDHKFLLINGELFSSGSFSDQILGRYLKNSKKILVIARIIKSSQSTSRLSKIENENIEIIDGTRISLSTLKSIVRNTDGLIIRLPSILGLKVAVISILYRNKHIIELVGDTWDAYWLHSIKGKLAALPLTLLTKTVVYFSKHVVYVTERYLQKKYPTKGDSTNISNVFLTETDEDVLEWRLEKISNRVDHDILKIGTIGSLDMKYKGQMQVIKAINNLYTQGIRNIEYQMVGGGQGKHLREFVLKHGLESVIKFVGTIPHDEIFSWIDSIDIYIQPSLTEGLPRSVIEAMSRGCPCIVSSAGGNPELIAIDYIFHNGNLNQLTEIITKLSVKGNMIDQSQYNFHKSIQYSAKFLESKRARYIQKCLIDKI